MGDEAIYIILLIFCVFMVFYTIGLNIKKEVDNSSELTSVLSEQDEYILSDICQNNISIIEYYFGDDGIDNKIKTEIDDFNRVLTNIPYPINFTQLVQGYARYIKENRYIRSEFVKRIHELKSSSNLSYKEFFTDYGKKTIEITRFNKEFCDYIKFVREKKNCYRKYLYLYKYENELCFSDIDKHGIGKYSIKIEDIKSFSRYGDVFNQTTIEGSGGGGSSLAGALIGGVIAGEAGAIIGSRKKIEEIKSSNMILDKRLTILEFNDQSNAKYFFFDSNAYDEFLKLIPNKEINFRNRNTLIEHNQDGVKDDVLNKIEKLSQLKEKGILTDEEFKEKKKVLLDKIK